MVDFVPNHTAPDHPWVKEHPEFYVQGSAADLEREPHNYRRVETSSGSLILAYGRDPYFPGWPDTFQLNYRHPGLREAMAQELLKLAEIADGVRCDMAMLILPEIFQRTWGERSLPSRRFPTRGRTFLAGDHRAGQGQEPGLYFYGGSLLGSGVGPSCSRALTIAMIRSLYDRLLSRDAAAVRGHLWADLAYQNRLARFLENHDEPRAAHDFPQPVHQAAAVITYFTPGLRFFHEGQLEGRRVKVSMHLGRRPEEPVDPGLAGILSETAGLPEAPGSPGRPLATPGSSPGLGGQPHLGPLPGLCLGRRDGPTPAGHRELWSHPGPVLCGLALG